MGAKLAAGRGRVLWGEICEMNLSVQFIAIECCTCRVQFAMTAEMDDARRNDHRAFYCPAGHSQVYRGQSDLEKERQARQRAEQNLAYERERADRHANNARAQERRASAFKGVCTRIKKRVGKGVCPCCNRTFAQLSAHMATQHPNWAPDAEQKPEGAAK